MRRPADGVDLDAARCGACKVGEEGLKLVANRYFFRINDEDRMWEGGGPWCEPCGI